MSRSVSTISRVVSVIRAAHGRKRPVGMLLRRAHAGDGRLEGHGLEIAAGLGVL